jgi:hypothetical protein
MSLEDRVERLERQMKTIREALETIVEALRPEDPKSSFKQPDLSEAIRAQGDRRPLNWLIRQLDGERKLANLNYELKEDGDGLTVKVWFAPGLDLEDQAKVRGWIAWAKNAVERRLHKPYYFVSSAFFSFSLALFVIYGLNMFAPTQNISTSSFPLFVKPCDISLGRYMQSPALTSAFSSPIVMIPEPLII